MKEDKIIEVLEQLLQEVQLLTVSTKATALNKFKSDYLSTPLKQQMYNAFDGERTLQEISNDLNCKINTLQIFVQKLVENDLVDSKTVGKSRIISKSTSKIAIHYAQKALVQNDIENEQ